MYATLIVVAALWGGATGLLLPRAAYRLSVEPDEPWRQGCPADHPFTGPARGWLGPATCATCRTLRAAAASGSGGAAPYPARSVSGGGPESFAAAPPPVPDSPPAAPPPVPGPSPVPDSDSDSASDPLTTPDPEPTPASASAAGTERAPRPDPAAVATGPGRAVPYRPSPLVPLLTALTCALLAAAVGARPELGVWLLLAPFAVLLALVDRNVHRLPDQLTLPLAGAATVLLGLAALLPGHGGAWHTAVLGGLALGACYFVLFLINPNGMGFGDVKLALSLGVVLGWYGWPTLFVGAFVGFLLGSLYGIGLILLRRAGRKSAIPFGPFMIIGAFLGIVLGALAAP
ncbi:prepilin peptidase [Streptomyces sp. NRRL F-5135]|uniref:prepilin peptidase n=1 Tax=Streptomyces sp. NRRL F-5135 TaxID=1463858 RepID=UPI0004CBE9AC|nr:A24 family peptidase [Streptomyces sp. NRRL F-5135]